MSRGGAGRAPALLAIAAVAGLGGVGAGCAGELANPARFADCPPGYVEQLFQSKCGDCHGATEPDAALDLVSAGVASRVAGAPSMSTCDGRMLVEPAGADHLLLEKLEPAPTCGSRMPLGQPGLSVTEVECVRRWIDELAEAP